MKRAISFMTLILFISIGFTIWGPQKASSAPPSEPVRVLIKYKHGSKGPIEQALKSANAEFHYDFEALNTLAVTLPETALHGIVNNPNVLLIEEDAPRYLVSLEKSNSLAHPIISSDSPYEEQVIPYGVDMVKARDVWDTDRDGIIDMDAPTGEGLTVCIIDSGLYTEHEDFLGVNVIGGYSARNNRPWDEDGLGHGTHVAGTITAMNNEIGVVGVTPGTVSLYIVRVFDNNGNWIWFSTLIDAANRCADAGADIISMSLAGPTFSATENLTFQNLYDAGILSVAAASNQGTSDYAYPASYDAVISVGALDSTMTWAYFSNFNDQVELAAPGVDVLSTVPFIEVNTVAVDDSTFYGNHIENTARGSATGALTDGGLCGAINTAWSGKVVLCERGAFSFEDKVLNVQNSGGLAALIYNNVPGNFLGTIAPTTASIIGLSLSQEDGQFLVTNHLETSTIVTSNTPMPGSGYEAWAGTSMATPHVASVAALVWSCKTSATNVEVRNALTQNTLDLGAAGRDDYYGFGLVQAWEACQSLNPTAVELLSLTAETEQNSVHLTWETASEVDNAGFNLYRAVGLNGEKEQINAALIPSAAPGGTDGATYHYMDRGVNFGVQYYYWLESIDLTMRVKSLAGPVTPLWWKSYLPVLSTGN